MAFLRKINSQISHTQKLLKLKTAQKSFPESTHRRCKQLLCTMTEDIKFPQLAKFIYSHVYKKAQIKNA